MIRTNKIVNWLFNVLFHHIVRIGTVINLQGRLVSDDVFKVCHNFKLHGRLIHVESE